MRWAAFCGCSLVAGLMLGWRCRGVSGAVERISGRSGGDVVRESRRGLAAVVVGAAVWSPHACTKELAEVRRGARLPLMAGFWTLRTKVWPLLAAGLAAVGRGIGRRCPWRARVHRPALAPTRPAGSLEAPAAQAQLKLTGPLRTLPALLTIQHFGSFEASGRDARRNLAGIWRRQCP